MPIGTGPGHGRACPCRRPARGRWQCHATTPRTTRAPPGRRGAWHSRRRVWPETRPACGIAWLRRIRQGTCRARTPARPRSAGTSPRRPSRARRSPGAGRRAARPRRDLGRGQPRSQRRWLPRRDAQGRRAVGRSRARPADTPPGHQPWPPIGSTKGSSGGPETPRYWATARNGPQRSSRHARGAIRSLRERMAPPLFRCGLRPSGRFGYDACRRHGKVQTLLHTSVNHWCESP